MSSKTKVNIQIEVPIDSNLGTNPASLFSEGDTLKIIKIAEDGKTLICERISTSSKQNLRITQDPIESQKSIVRVYFKDGSYKSMSVTSSTTVEDLCSIMAKKMDLAAFTSHFTLSELGKQGEERILDKKLQILPIIKSWKDPNYFRFIFAMKKEEKDKLSIRLTRRLEKKEEKKSEKNRPLTIFNVTQNVSPEETDDLEHILASLEEAVKKREKKLTSSNKPITIETVPDLDDVLASMAEKV